MQKFPLPIYFSGKDQELTPLITGPGEWLSSDVSPVNNSGSYFILILNNTHKSARQLLEALIKSRLRLARMQILPCKCGLPC